jgi:hypothetical protein
MDPTGQETARKGSAVKSPNFWQDVDRPVNICAKVENHLFASRKPLLLRLFGYLTPVWVISPLITLLPLLALTEPRLAQVLYDLTCVKWWSDFPSLMS